ncbi:MAG: ornithine cyclodeaminase family protein, partial [Actinomycetes bacterium]
MLLLTGEEVAALLDLDELIDALAPAMSDLSGARASVPDRIGAVIPEVDGRLMAMPGYVPSQSS